MDYKVVKSNFSSLDKQCKKLYYSIMKRKVSTDLNNLLNFNILLFITTITMGLIKIEFLFLGLGIFISTLHFKMIMLDITHNYKTFRYFNRTIFLIATNFISAYLMGDYYWYFFLGLFSIKISNLIYTTVWKKIKI